MKITERKEGIKVVFKDLDIGKVFMYNENFYIKTENVVLATEVEDVTPMNIDEFTFTAVNLKSGILVGFFEEDTIVTPLDCELLYRKL